MRGETQVLVRVNMKGGTVLEIDLPKHAMPYWQLVEVATAMAQGLIDARYDAHVVASKTVEQELHELRKPE